MEKLSLKAKAIQNRKARTNSTNAYKIYEYKQRVFTVPYTQRLLGFNSWPTFYEPVPAGHAKSSLDFSPYPRLNHMTGTTPARASMRKSGHDRRDLTCYQPRHCPVERRSCKVRHREPKWKDPKRPQPEVRHKPWQSWHSLAWQRYAR